MRKIAKVVVKEQTTEPTQIAVEKITTPGQAIPIF